MSDSPILYSPFRQAHQKVEWARTHILKLEAIIADFKANAYVFGCEFDAQRGENVVTIEVVPHGDILGLVVGDAVHTLASALDYCWNVLWRNAGKSKSRESFPSHETLANLEDALGKSRVTRACPKASDLMLKTVRPYNEAPDGNYPIWAIKKLDNVDKHNLLIPTLNIFESGRFVVMAGDEAVDEKPELMICNGTIDLKGSGRLEIFSSKKPVKIYQKVPPSFEVCFGEGQFFEGGPLVETLTGIADAVAQVVERFATAFPEVSS